MGRAKKIYKDEKEAIEKEVDKYLIAEISSWRQSGEMEIGLKDIAEDDRDKSDGSSDEEEVGQSGSVF